MDDLVRTRVYLYDQTEKAILIGPPRLRDSNPSHQAAKQWLPRQLLQDITDIGNGMVELQLPQWLADKKGLTHGS